MKNNRKIAKNIVWALGAQMLSLAISFVIGFIVPKFIDEYQYSYWQTFMLYYGYVGVFHFGILDGLILRYSQYSYDQLDKAKIRSQFQLLMVITSTVAGLISIGSAFVLGGPYFIIAILVCVGIVIKNFFAYTSFTFQMTNRINHYAIMSIVQRLLYGGLVVGMLIGGVKQFYWYCIADLASELIATLISCLFNRGMYFGKMIPLREALSEMWGNISAGAFLMIANLASTLLVGGAKMVIQWRWDELVFGKLAFSFQVSNLFLTFVTAISVVLFPSLKRMKEGELPGLYGKMRTLLSLCLFGVLLGYFPACWILRLWLPKYAESLVYLGVLLPIIVFMSKVNFLTNNYLKVYRKERLMLLINVCSVAIGFLLFLVCAYGFDSVDWLLYSVVAVIAISCFISELAVAKILKQVHLIDFAVEAVMTVTFMVLTRACSLLVGFLIYLGVMALYFVLYTLPAYKRRRCADGEEG